MTTSRRGVRVGPGGWPLGICRQCSEPTDPEYTICRPCQGDDVEDDD